MSTDNQTTTTAGKREWTPEPWRVGGDMAMRHTHCTQIIGTIDGSNFIVASFNYNFLEPAIRNCVRAVACVNACAGIADPAAFVSAVRAVVSNRSETGTGKHRAVMVFADDMDTLRAELTKIEPTKPSEKP